MFNVKDIEVIISEIRDDYNFGEDGLSAKDAYEVLIRKLKEKEKSNTEYKENYAKALAMYTDTEERAIESMIAVSERVSKEKINICYKTNEECKYNCKGLCKDNC